MHWSQAIWGIAMRGAAPACYLLLLFVSVSPAWAEGARTPRGAWAVSDRELRAEQRSRAATTSICEGCMGRVGSREGASRPLAANLPRNVRGRSPALITRAWIPTDTWAGRCVQGCKLRLMPLAGGPGAWGLVEGRSDRTRPLSSA